MISFWRRKSAGPAAPEKNRMPVSFLIAGGLHLLVIAGGHYGFVTAPEYGIQGSAASLEVYMVAALPEQARNQTVKTGKKEEVLHSLLKVKSEMEVVQPEEKQAKRETVKTEKKEALKTSKGKTSEKKSDVKGDGSSPEPGQSITTLYARGSSESDGKTGKYQNFPPQYPFLAERNGWQGVVVLKALIEKEGKPSKVLLETSSGHRILDDAALKTVKQWKFTAGRIGAMNVSTWIKIPIRFVLDESGPKVL